MFSFFSSKKSSDRKNSSQTNTPKKPSFSKHISLASSLTNISGEPLEEKIPDNKLTLLGKETPLLFKKTVLYGSQDQSNHSKIKRSRTYFIEPFIMERKRILSQEQIMENEDYNHFISRLEFQSNVLLIGDLDPFFVKEVCRKAKKVIWFLRNSSCCQNGFSQLDFESKFGFNGNLTVEDDFKHKDRFFVKGIFGVKDGVNEKVDYVFWEIKEERRGKEIIGFFLRFQ